MPFVKADKKAFFVTCMDYVSVEDGTGIVHTAPAFGEDDYQCGTQIRPACTSAGRRERLLHGHAVGRAAFVMEDGLDVEIIKWLAGRKQDLRQGKSWNTTIRTAGDAELRWSTTQSRAGTSR